MKKLKKTSGWKKTKVIKEVKFEVWKKSFDISD